MTANRSATIKPKPQRPAKSAATTAVADPLEDADLGTLVEHQEPIKIAAPIEVTGYTSDVRFFATRYKQGGRTVYSINLSLEQIASLITPPDPTRPSPGNREVRPKHAAGFAKYLRAREDWIMPGMILRAPAIFEFDVQAEVSGVQFGIISFSRRLLADLHILDGQHRILGIAVALQDIAEDLDKARNHLASARRVDPSGRVVTDARAQIAKLEKQRARLDEERASIEIYVEEDLVKYRQMFFDIADNALGITASVKSRFDSTKVVNRALPLVMEHRLLHGRVDNEADRVGRGNANLMGAKHVGEIIRTSYVGLDGRVSRVQESTFKESDVAARTNKFFDIAMAAFPPLEAISLGQLKTEDLRKSSLLGSVLFLRVLAGAYQELKADHAFSDDMVEKFFETLAPHVNGPITSTGIWMTHMPNPIFSEGGLGPHGRRQDLKLLKNTLVDWAITKPSFLTEPVVMPPVEEQDEDHLDFGKGYEGFGGVPAAS